jgi:hypothetical protein
MRRHCSSNPARRRRRNSNPVHGRPCNSNPARPRPAVDRMRRRCRSSPVRGHLCSGSPEHCLARSAHPPGSASLRRKTKAVSAPTSRYACCQSGRPLRTPRGRCR